MYDDLDCRYTLPLPQYAGLGFQTKSLGSNMDWYRITAEGILKVNKRGDYDGDGDKDMVTTDYTGTVFFYTNVSKHLGLPHSWVEFKAEFVHGLLFGDITIADETTLAPGRTQSEVITIPHTQNVPLSSSETIMHNLTEALNSADEAMLYLRTDDMQSVLQHIKAARDSLCAAAAGIAIMRKTKIVNNETKEETKTQQEVAGA